MIQLLTSSTTPQRESFWSSCINVMSSVAFISSTVPVRQKAHDDPVSGVAASPGRIRRLKCTSESQPKTRALYHDIIAVGTACKGRHGVGEFYSPSYSNLLDLWPYLWSQLACLAFLSQSSTSFPFISYLYIFYIIFHPYLSVIVSASGSYYSLEFFFDVEFMTVLSESHALMGLVFMTSTLGMDFTQTRLSRIDQIPKVSGGSWPVTVATIPPTTERDLCT